MTNEGLIRRPCLRVVILGLIWAVVAGLLSATASANSALLSMGIAGGTSVAAGDPRLRSIVRIEYYLPGTSPTRRTLRNTRQVCTGTLVRGNKILTAGHCQREVGISDTMAFAVFYDPMDGHTITARIELTQYQYNPNYILEPRNYNDMMLYTLTAAPPITAVPMAIAGIDVGFPPRRNQVYTSGFGRLQNGDPSPLMMSATAQRSDWSANIRTLQEEIAESERLLNGPGRPTRVSSLQRLEETLADQQHRLRGIQYRQDHFGSSFNQRPETGISLHGDSGSPVMQQANDGRYVIIAVATAISGTTNANSDAPISMVPQTLLAAPLSDDDNVEFLTSHL